MEFNSIIKNIIISKDYSLFGKNINFNVAEKGITVNISTLSEIRKLSNLPEIKKVIEYYSGLSVLNVSGSFEYISLIGNKKSKDYANYIKEKINETLPMITSYHTLIYPQRKKCYEGLERLYFDGKLLETPTYNHCGVTGRTSIVKGHNYLTMKKGDRKKLRHKDKVLVEVDFKSCEPFFFLKSQNIEIPGDDVYFWLMEKYNINNIERDKLKRGILSLIYGANTYTTSKIMQLELKTVEKIKDDIGINDLEDRLKKEFDKNGFILNYYGRPITSNNNLVNYWIQSSTVDYCSLAFKQFYEANNIKPCFFIHDSMTFCVDASRLQSIINKNKIKEKISNITIPINFTLFD